MASEDNADTEASKSDELKKNEEQKPRHPVSHYTESAKNGKKPHYL